MSAIQIKDPELQRAIIAVLIDRLNRTLETLANQFSNTVFYVDCRGAVADARWHDELHPTNDGYASVAERFAQVIDAAVPTP